MRRLAAVAELGQRALAIGDLQSLMDHTVALVARTLVVDYCSVLQLLSNGSDLQYIAGVGWPDGRVLARAIVPGGLRSQAGYTVVQLRQADLAATARRHPRTRAVGQLSIRQLASTFVQATKPAPGS
jgi:hypothetical protein